MRPVVKLLLIAFGLLCLLLSTVQAQDAKIRVEIGGDEQHLVGQQLVIGVTILAPGYFDGAVNFDIPDPDQVLLVPPTRHPVVGSETIAGTRYVSQIHQFMAWPMRAGDQTIPAITARFAYKSNPLDQESQAATVTTRALPIKVESPPGTEGMGTVISARDLKVEERWQPAIDGDGIVAGSAFTRTITFIAPNVPGMIFPPFPAGDIDGLGIYSKPQVLDENSARGGLMGKRQDVVTYVAKRPGQFTIPAARFRWFDLDANELRTEEFAAHTLNVIANPNMASGAAANGVTTTQQKTSFVQSLNWQQWSAIAIALLVLFGLGTSRKVRQQIYQRVQPLRPVHLQPLYPGPKNSNSR